MASVTRAPGRRPVKVLAAFQAAAGTVVFLPRASACGLGPGLGSSGPLGRAAPRRRSLPFFGVPKAEGVDRPGPGGGRRQVHPIAPFVATPNSELAYLQASMGPGG